MTSKKKILIIDDEEAFGKMVKINLEMLGDYEVRVETMGGNGLQAAWEFGPDLILLDVIMRDMSGTDVVKWIRADSHLRHTPIIFLTAMSEVDIAPEKVGGEKFPLIQKPVSIEDLTQSIEASLGRVK